MSGTTSRDIDAATTKFATAMDAARRALRRLDVTSACSGDGTLNIGSAEAQKFAAYTKMMISSNKVPATSVMTNQDKIQQLKDFQEPVEEITKRILWLKQYAASRTKHRS